MKSGSSASAGTLRGALARPSTCYPSGTLRATLGAAAFVLLAGCGSPGPRVPAATGATADPSARAAPATSTAPAVPQWREVELALESARDYANPYTDIDVHAIFYGPAGDSLLRPAFWDGGRTWRIRFAPPAASGEWRWRTVASEPDDAGLHGRSGRLRAVPYVGSNPLLRHGLLRMSSGRRNVVHADGTTFLLVGDTPWALPFRGAVEAVTRYARNRRARGFNAALLMTVQPDARAEGPEARGVVGGFDVAFRDLPEGHLNRLDPAYFQVLDTLTTILVDHGIVPVYNPVFQGFGWKGLGTVGASVAPAEYVRFARYLVARYGARPAMWLVSADGTGKEPVTAPAGRAVERWDAYGQPTGIHYSPFDDRAADWTEDPAYGFHGNRSHQAADWLDFQWAQTGHGGEHLPGKVARMYDNEPTKAAANGEPTYERIGHAGNATGWWQGHEAWLQLTSGGTMGVVYGAGGLWNWKITPDEEGWPAWADTHASWGDAIEFDGSRYVGYLSRALRGLDLADIERRPDLAGGALALARPDRLYLVYLPEGGDVALDSLTGPLPYHWFDPRTGTWADSGHVEPESRLAAPDEGPWVLVAARPSESRVAETRPAAGARDARPRPRVVVLSRPRSVCSRT